MANEKKAAKGKKTTVNTCLCGCGQAAKSRFLMGHDAKLKSLIKKLAGGDGDRALLKNKRVREYLSSAPWMTPELTAALSKKVEA